MTGFPVRKLAGGALLLLAAGLLLLLTGHRAEHRR
jgi:hypothetical protein